MAKDVSVEGITDVGDDQGVARGERGGWSARWSGDPDASQIRMPSIERRRIGGLAAAIEDEVIPRLLLSQRSHLGEVHTDVKPTSAAGEGCIDEFVQLLLTDELEVAYAYIDSVRVRGVTLSGIYLELLAPAARVLGTMWEEDRVSFADVTVALCRLHDVDAQPRCRPGAAGRFGAAGRGGRCWCRYRANSTPSGCCWSRTFSGAPAGTWSARRSAAMN